MRDVGESRPRQTETGGLARGRQFLLMSIRDAQRMVVRACGRLVLGHGAHELFWTSHLDQVAPSDLALDLSCVNDIDAQGLGVLAALARGARQRGITVSVIAASSRVQRLVEMTPLDRALPGAWNERIGVVSCSAARARPTIVHPRAQLPGAIAEAPIRDSDST